jgi:hypothetical protein
MTSYEFDSFQTDNNYLTLYKSTCCGITYGNPRKHVIHRDAINFITYGRYFNGILALFGVFLLGFGLLMREENLYFVSFWIGFYSVLNYANSSMIICAGNIYFTSSCCTDHENLLEWFRQQEMGVAGTTATGKGAYSHIV